MEELKLLLLAEKSKVEQDLSSERELGRDRDAMLERSKRREGELQERIGELEAELEVVSNDREKARVESSRTVDKLAHVQREFDALVEQAGMLEKQSKDWRQREADLLRDTKDRSSAHSKLKEQKAELERQVDMLKREVLQKDEAMKRSKERMDMNVLELEKRLQLEKTKA